MFKEIENTIFNEKKEVIKETIIKLFNGLLPNDVIEQILNENNNFDIFDNINKSIKIGRAHV